MPAAGQPIHFRARLQAEDDSIFIELPSAVVARLGSRKRPPVLVRLNGHEYRTTVAVYGGKSFLGVRRDIRQAAGLSVGESIGFSIAVDLQPRQVEIPRELAAALRAEPRARAAFDRLSYTRRKEYAGLVQTAMREETRRARVEKVVKALREGEGL